MEELKALVKLAQAGDLKAYDKIVDRFQDMAMGYAYSLLGDFHLAEDASQDAFVEAYLYLAKLQDPSAFPGWFRRIVFTRCNRITRKKRIAMVDLEVASETLSDEKGPEQLLEEQVLKDQVLQIIRALPEAQRTVVMLFYISELSQKEISAFLEIPITTVNNRLNVSRKRLKEEILNMATEDLQAQNPSRDRIFAEKVQNHLQVIRSIHNEYASRLTDLFSRSLGRKVDLTALAVEQSTYDAFIQSLPKPCCAYTFSFNIPTQKDGGWVILDLSRPFGCALAGRTTESGNTPTELSINERNRLGPIITNLVANFGIIWKFPPGVLSDAYIHEDPEELPSYPHADREEPIIQAKLMIEADGLSGIAGLCYPANTIEKVILPYLDQRV